MGNERSPCFTKLVGTEAASVLRRKILCVADSGGQ